MIRRVLAAVLVVAVAAVLLVAAWPQLFHLEAAPVVAQVVSLRGLDIAIAVALIVVIGLVALAWRASRRFLGSIVALLVVFCLVSLAVLSSRGWGGAAPPKDTAERITVLSWNTKGDAPGAAAIAKLALARHADVVALPETTLVTGKQVAVLMRAGGHPMWVYSSAFDYVSKSRSTTLLISAALGTYSVDKEAGNTAVLPTVIARPDDGAGPTIVAVHAVSPIPKEMRNWRADLAWLSAKCAGGNTIMAGDFNSTLDHLRSHGTAKDADFGACTDAGSASGTAAIATWPTILPAQLGAQIDHVMYTPNWRAVGMRVIDDEDASGSDHRPILVTLAPAP
jgi:endonuclease/exonuclease/phosphatase (EEP) superfamily protein YafD